MIYYFNYGIKFEGWKSKESGHWTTEKWRRPDSKLSPWYYGDYLLYSDQYRRDTSDAEAYYCVYDIRKKL